MKKALLVFTLTIFALTTMAVAGPPSEVWNETYESGGDDLPYGIATDAAGNIYVTGYYGDLGVAAACRTIKYDTDGNVLWNKLYDEDVVDAGLAVAVDGSGNVYVAGLALIANYDYLLIKYNSDGDVLWVETWGAPGVDMAWGVAADAAGNAYVTGIFNNGPNSDFRTIKYDSGGNLQWGQPHDEFGNRDEAYGVAVDGAGNVYVAGLTNNGLDDDFLTVKYDADGNLEWSDVRDENYEDRAYGGVAVDPGGDVYVGGGSEDDGGTDVDFFTVKYDTDGNFQWKRRFEADYTNYAWGIVVDQFFVYLAGQTFNGVDNDFLTLRYDKEGNLGWEKDFDSGDEDLAYGVAVDGSQHVYVTGFHDDGSDSDFRTIKYEQDDVEVAETSTHSPIILEVMDNFTSTPTICYALPAGVQGTLTFYSADGRKIESYTLDPAQSAFPWSTRNTPSGVYFAEVSCGNLSATVRTIVTR